jgi:diadenosine tetraphosphate (Ap4A) HIT family hydrolase
LHALTEEERREWIEDIARIGKAVTELCRPAKLNVSMLGNLVPHLHCHIMPRYPDDPDWGHPPHYRRPAERRALSAEEYEELRQSLRRTIEGLGIRD